MKSPRFYLIMGVSGCGKTTVGQLLAENLGWAFYDADDFHPPANVAKMANGIPLEDTDREPWLQKLHELIASCLQADQPGVLACSALKARYRHTLMADNPGVELVYLKGSYDLIWSRMADRADHYMKPEMLQSQFEALEEPLDALVVDINDPVEQIVERIYQETMG
jgi:gluconokinase